MTAGENRRRLRRRLVALLLLSPSMCVLPLLGLIAPAGPIRWLVWGVSGVIVALIATLAWRATVQLHALTHEDPDAQAKL